MWHSLELASGPLLRSIFRTHQLTLFYLPFFISLLFIPSITYMSGMTFPFYFILQCEQPRSGKWANLLSITHYLFPFLALLGSEWIVGKGEYDVAWSLLHISISYLSSFSLVHLFPINNRLTYIPSLNSPSFPILDSWDPHHPKVTRIKL